jgi:hypothetical protein
MNDDEVKYLTLKNHKYADYQRLFVACLGGVTFSCLISIGGGGIGF